MSRNRWLLVSLFLCFPMLSASAAAPAARPAIASPAAEAQLQESKEVITITGVAAPHWKLVYGKMSYAPKYWHPLLVQAGGHRAWYGYGSWLRLLDTQKGEVIGRWQFPYAVVKLTPEGEQVTVDTELRREYESNARIYRGSERLDPATPRMTPLPAENLMQARQGETEVVQAFFPRGIDPRGLKPEEARAALPGLEEQMRRDPLSVWCRLYYWRALETLQDKRAATVISGVPPSATGTNYGELLAASGALTRWGNYYAASEYYESGYQDFLARGNDPRLLQAIIDRLLLYNPFPPQGELPAAEQAQAIERIFKLTPYSEFAWIAWDALAKRAAAEGRVSDAALWRGRSQAAYANSVAWGGDVPSILRTDRANLAALAALLAMLACFFVFGAHYSQQHRAELAAKQPRPGFFRRLSFFNVKYWTRAQRFSFLVVVVLFWLLLGYAQSRVAVVLRIASTPISSFSGTFAGPLTRDYFLTLPASPQRDLLVAVSDQQSGDAAKAEGEYRQLPQFAEAWNNLGVLLARAGKTEDARQAYEHALRIDPELAEALYNLGRPVQSEWVQAHQQYLPNQPMVAVPSGAEMRMAFAGPRDYRLKETLLGPFAPGSMGALGRLTDSPVLALPTGKIAQLVYLLILLGSLALLFRRPRPVSRAGGKISAVFEILFPGTNPKWGILGGLVSLTWLYLVIQAVFLYEFRTPYILFAIATPNTLRVYGVLVDFWALAEGLGPSKQVAYGLPALLFVVNLVVVLWQRRHDTPYLTTLASAAR